MIWTVPSKNSRLIKPHNFGHKHIFNILGSPARISFGLPPNNTLQTLCSASTMTDRQPFIVLHVRFHNKYSMMTTDHAVQSAKKVTNAK